VQYTTLGSAEVTGDVAALLLSTIDREGADFLIRGDEIVVEILADIGVG